MKADLHLPEYFSKSDQYETLQTSQLTTKDDEYRYASGCIYKGDWLGGFRHGKGECTWPDGSHYNGNWSYGFPYGQGTFKYKDSEVFTGNWVNPYAHGKNRSYLDDVVQGKRDGYGNS